MTTCLSEKVTAADIMTRQVVCLNAELDLHECEKILLDRGISGAPVVDQEGRLQGVLSKTDLVGHHYTSGEEEKEVPPPYRLAEGAGDYVVEFNTRSAADVMTPVPCVASEHATLSELAALMVRRAVHRVVICKDRKVVGIVSSMDVLRALAGRAAAEGWELDRFPG